MSKRKARTWTGRGIAGVMVDVYRNWGVVNLWSRTHGCSAKLTVPASLTREIRPGDRVTVTIEVEPGE